MDLTLDSDSTAIGSLFQQIIADMKNSTPLWEDFVAKASKLHACLRAAIQAIASYLDAFQKIADAATNSRGASKDIGTALTRVCLRHKAVETRMKTFTCTIMNSLIVPMQDKLEEWKRQVVTIDKEHSKEYKRCRTELKKRSSDTLRLQKKARKGQSDLQSLVDSHMQDVSLRRAELEDVERKSLRSAMVEERLRYCNFVYMLQPVVKEECEVMSELGHLQEAMHSIAVVTKEPYILPQSSEELILESKSTFNLYPESPGGGSSSQGCSNSLGSRKSSVCSISSMNSSGSNSSPGHHYQRSCSQLIRPAIRLKLGESSDSGFCSTPALTAQSSATTSQLHAVSTWPPHNQDAVQTIDRPHTISSAYEKGHQRPSVTVYTFQNPETTIDLQKSPVSVGCRPPLPIRCSSLERPISATGTRSSNINLIQRQCPSPIPAHITKEHPQLQPTYVNMSELASMAASKITNLQLQQQQLVQQQSQKQPLLQQQEMNTSNQSRTLLQISFDTSVDNSSPNTPNLPLAEGTVASITNCSTVGITPRTSNKSSLNLLKSQKTLPQPSTNTNSIQTTLTLHGDGSIISNRLIDDKLKITETDSKLLAKSKATSSNIKVLSPEADDILRASVMQKTSMFEKLEQKQQIVNNNLLPMTARNSHIISKNEESYTCSEMTDKDSGCPSRITRRSSINSIKPTPPIRRSSSVTPNHALSMPNSPNLISQNLMTTSVESLPPPPAFLLDKTENALPTINVAKTVKALTVIRHTPASPSALRRASTQQNLTPTIQSYRSSNIPSSGIYAQPKQVSKLSSFRTQNPGTQKTNTSLLAQLNARLMPNKQAEKQNITPTNEFSIYQQKLSQDNRHNQSINVQHMHSSEPNSPNHPSHSQPEQIYSCVNDRYYYDVQQQNQSQHEGYLHSNNDTSGIVLAKTKTEFFEKLNTKLAKQGLSGRAFAVRNLINSKALPDPRLCHESLMDQIKRGATLKHNRTINDRSAPKIH